MREKSTQSGQKRRRTATFIHQNCCRHNAICHDFSSGKKSTKKLRNKIFSQKYRNGILFSKLSTHVTNIYHLPMVKTSALFSTCNCPVFRKLVKIYTCVIFWLN